jgi:CYTH domain-containing protein
LVIAEIELKDPKDNIQLPVWIGKEVTGDNRYYNSYLAAHGLPS